MNMMEKIIWDFDCTRLNFIFTSLLNEPSHSLILKQRPQMTPKMLGAFGLISE